jgi:hypothetical protein
MQIPKINPKLFDAEGLKVPPTTCVDEEVIGIPAIFPFAASAFCKPLNSVVDCALPEFPFGEAAPPTTTEPTTIEFIVIESILGAPKAVANAWRKDK